MQWSNHQRAIFDFVADTMAGSGVVEAVAGSGKTTTIVEAMKYLPKNQSVAFMAFNASIAKELKARVPAGVETMTMNSLGHRAVMRAVGKVELDSNKVRGIVRAMVPEHWRTVDPDAVTAVVQLVGLAKAHGLVPDAPGFEDLAVHHGVDYTPEIDLYARKALRANNTDTRVIDFNDQLYFPVINHWYPRQQFDVIFLDEAQDVSTVQRQLVAMALKPGGRVVAVGDRRQAIYGFRGADSASLDNIATEFGATRLPLSVTYRCPAAVVRQAQTVAPEIQAAAGAPEGFVGPAGDQFPGPADMVVCRNNAPLLSLAFQMLSNGQACNVMGRDISASLVTFIQRFKAGTVGDLLAAVDRWYVAELDKALRAENESKAASVEDRVACVYALADGLPSTGSVGLVVARVKEIFAAGGGATLSSVHRAKGLEADNVFVLEPGLMPSRFARKPWQQVQEQNLMYVAWTRAGKNLYFME